MLAFAYDHPALVFGVVMALLLALSNWCIQSHNDKIVRDRGGKEVKVGTLKVLD